MLRIYEKDSGGDRHDITHTRVGRDLAKAVVAELDFGLTVEEVEDDVLSDHSDRWDDAELLGDVLTVTLRDRPLTEAELADLRQRLAAL